MALQDGTQLQNIGNALSGFSAGLQGQLPQFQQGLQQQQLINQQQQERQQKMALERQKTMFTDAQAALSLLESDNVDGVIQLGLNRLELLQNFPDANPEDTQRLTQLAIAAKNGSEEAKELLRGELENTVEIGKATGVLVEPEKDLMEISPGATIYDPNTGKSVFTAPDREGAGTTRQDKLLAMTERLSPFVDNPEDVAADIVDGNIDVEVLEDGSVRLVDKVKAATGRGAEAVIELPVGSLAGEADRVEPEPEQTLYELAAQSGGIAGAGKQFANILAGQFGVSAFPETAEAYQTLNTAVGDMVRSLAVNPRFPVGEMTRLREEINITPKITNPGPVAQANMRSIDRSLRTRLQQFERDAMDTSLSPDVRNTQKTNAAQIRNFLDILGVPEKVDTSTITVDAVSSMDSGDARLIINQITEEDYENLSPEAAEALMEKARGG